MIIRNFVSGKVRFGDPKTAALKLHMKVTERKLRSFVAGDLVWCYCYIGPHNERHLGLVVKTYGNAKQYDVYMFEEGRVRLNVAYGMTLVYNIESKD